MSCHDIMDKKPLTFTPDVTVEDALMKMRSRDVRTAVVINDSDVAVGLFSLRNLMETILPVSMTSDSGMQSVTFNSAPGLDMRLQKVLMEPLSVVMDRRFPSVYPDTPEAEAARLIVNNGDSVVVLDEDTERLLGMISDQDLVEGLLDGFSTPHKIFAE